MKTQRGFSLLEIVFVLLVIMVLILIATMFGPSHTTPQNSSVWKVGQTF